MQYPGNSVLIHSLIKHKNHYAFDWQSRIFAALHFMYGCVQVDFQVLHPGVRDPSASPGLTGCVIFFLYRTWPKLCIGLEAGSHEVESLA